MSDTKRADAAIAFVAAQLAADGPSEDGGAYAVAVLGEEARAIERELNAAYEELRKLRPAVKAIFDRSVWDRAGKSKVIQLGSR